MTDAATVTLREPAPAAKPAQAQTTVVVDSLGRRLTIRELSILEESRIVRECGEYAGNAHYMVGYVIPTALIASIDEVKLHVPMTRGQIEAAIQIARREGLEAVMQHLDAKAKASTEAKDTDTKE
ncbi:MAG TPA: hypothetical protein VGV09_02475 [Steroidobacteraceae bacterium]|nr:hypothetical protein [Steroidobacteraceae bacterium]